MNSLVIKATGRKREEAADAEICVLGLRSVGIPRTTIDTDDLPEGWQVGRDIRIGELGIVPFGLKGWGEEITLPVGQRGRIIFLRHPWSGIVQVSSQLGSFELDLYSPSTEAISVDIATGATEPANRNALQQAELIPARRFAPRVEPGQSEAAKGEVVIRALDKSASNSGGNNVDLLRVEPIGFGVPADMSQVAGPAKSWSFMPDVLIDDQVWKGGVTSADGIVKLSCEDNGVIYLLRHAESGFVQISYGTSSIIVDLFSPDQKLLIINVADLQSSAAAINDVEYGIASHNTQEARSRRDFYARVTKDFDPALPVAIYVPRWHGVAMSTKMLFEQSMPVPEGHATHPDDLTDEDIEEYARIIADAGIRHLVISGGDIFNLRIIDLVSRLVPDLRVDMLWHSNFLQMNEHHDWNLLRHWVAALEDGTITKIGVVKEGLENWFARLGIESVFIPNVVPFDESKIKPTSVQDVVGIWLSGSSSYRKLPHTMLLALRNLPQLSLMGSGFDPQAQRMIQDLRLPFREISIDPLPQAQLHARMKKTAMSMYITISECSPMLPLESFAMGVPCLVGPSSHLFRRNAVLNEALIVRKPHSVSEISDKILGILHRQEELVKEYIVYHREEMEIAQDGIRRLLA